MKIRCYQTFCIYQKKNRCLLDKIEIEEAGLCRCCITVPLDETELELKKRADADSLPAYGRGFGARIAKIKKTLAIAPGL